MKKIKIIRCFIQYPFSQMQLNAEIVRESKLGFLIRMQTKQGHGRAIPFDGSVLLDCSYEEG